MPTEKEKKLASDQKEAKTTLKARMGKNPMRADVLRFVKYRREGNSINEASRKVLTQRVEEYKSTKKFSKTQGIKGKRHVPHRKTRKSYIPIAVSTNKEKSITIESQNKTYNVTVKSSLPLSSVKNMSACDLCAREKEYKHELEILQEKYKNVIGINKVKNSSVTQEIKMSPPNSPSNILIATSNNKNSIKPNTLAIINKSMSSNKNETTPSLFRKNEPVVNSLSKVKSIGENVVKPTNEDDFIEANTGVNLPSTTASVNAFNNTQK
jgi:hypothetical protein